MNNPDDARFWLVLVCCFAVLIAVLFIRTMAGMAQF